MEKFLPTNIVGSGANLVVSGMDIAAFRSKAYILKDISFLLTSGSCACCIHPLTNNFDCVEKLLIIIEREILVFVYMR